MASILSDADVQSRLEQLPDWTLQKNTITSVRTFSDFVAAIDFVNRLVEPAEAAGHHPDLTISYNRVTISLTTHDAGGITDQDLSMAATISEIS